MSNQDDPSHGMNVGQPLEELLHPYVLLASMDLRVLGEVEHAGRPALFVRARQKPFPEWLDPHGALDVGDEHAVRVDRARGVVLRHAALLGGEELSVTEVRELAFDEDFPPGTFAFVPPVGTHGLTIHQQTAAGEAPGWRAYGQPRVVEHEGLELQVLEQPEDQPWSQTLLFLERDGTAVRITSDLGLDTLLELAASFVPAPTEPPRLTS